LDDRRVIGTATLRSHWYGNATATYIRRANIPSRTYAKPQYRE